MDCVGRLPSNRLGRHGGTFVVLAVLAVSVGCSTQKWATLRSTPHNPLTERFDFSSSDGIKPSGRTVQLLRLYDLTADLQGDPRRLLEKLQAIIDREPTSDKVYAFAEVSYLAARHVEPTDSQLAMDLYGASVLYSYQYLFDGRFAAEWNAFDPQFRGACDLYNGSLEAGLRLIRARHGLKPGQVHTIETASGAWDVETVIRGGTWQVGDFDDFEFVSDWKLTGLNNHYRTYGLGVPMIAVRRNHADDPQAARYYPDNLSFPVTVLLRPEMGVKRDGRTGAVHYRAVLEIYDPLTISSIAIDQQRVPLESDLSMPLAHFLSKPEWQTLATDGLLHPEKLLRLPGQAKKPTMGLYMMQPYEPNKIPVLMVHGLWSSPVTWMAMYNDLRNSPEIRDRFQFWFYLYPTGQPFWFSATQLRRDLAEARKTLDPQRQNPALDQMVLIGHSMGGLVSRMQTIDSRDDFWHIVSDQPFDLVKADPEIRQGLQETFFFQPNPSIRRVITIGTPNRGCDYADGKTRWLFDQLIELPGKLVMGKERFVAENRALLRDTRLLEIKTSIDSLSPKSPVFPVMLASRRPPWVTYNNILGLRPKQDIFGKLTEGTDGIVSQESAHVDDAESELVVPADHTTVHAHPLSVLEVRRILLEHLAELRDFPASPPASQTAGMATGQGSVASRR
jgi:hypothetical protein